MKKVAHSPMFCKNILYDREILVPQAPDSGQVKKLSGGGFFQTLYFGRCGSDNYGSYDGHRPGFLDLSAECKTRQSTNMRYLGIDYGKRRIGLSYADGVGVAVPITPIIVGTGEDFWQRLAGVIHGRKIDAVVVGYPLAMNDRATPWTLRVEHFIKELAERHALPVYKSDERLTSVQVDSDLARHGLRAKRKNLRQQRESGWDDSRAATLILQDFLDELPNGTL
ncbi:MAG: Holliday junction resolvase RuvX [Puniceicoccales bacterium]|nr:Holliday junction resolvase RuvX [Puniceicoccales bacterium]